MTPDQPPVRYAAYAQALAALDAERVRCADLERERDEAWQDLEEMRIARDEAIRSRHYMIQKRDGWKARAEQLQETLDACSQGEVAAAQAFMEERARVADLEKALTEVVELDYDDPATCMAWARKIAREALAVPGRPGSGAPVSDEPESKHACQRCGSDDWTDVDYSGCSECREPPEPPECPHCHVELVDGTCVAGCYYIAPETQEDTP